VRPAIPCEKCGAPTNHQADKLVEPRSHEEAEAGAAFGGVIVAVFACRWCGWITSQKAAPDER
jgi:rubrerythrin